MISEGLTAGKNPHPDIEVAEAALDGNEDAVAAVMDMLRSPALAADLVARGASPGEASDLVGDLIGDCFGGIRAKGGLHRLLGRYNGGCPLPAFFRRVATNRLVSLKRASRHVVASDDDADSYHAISDFKYPVAGAKDDALVALLRDAIIRARARVDTEKLVFVRLIVSYGVPQNRLGDLLNWHESKVSRMKSEVFMELRTHIMAEVRKSDPWLELEWEDFMELCAESLDLFAY